MLAPLARYGPACCGRRHQCKGRIVRNDSGALGCAGDATQCFVELHGYATGFTMVAQKMVASVDSCLTNSVKGRSMRKVLVAA